MLVISLNTASFTSCIHVAPDVFWFNCLCFCLAENC
ncbi:Uncharacterised protein [Klebsiella pneumoniae subsp. pneumoniae]|uniref:Uncharacterized protein n=1 Tax=Klebsiella pneumoniae subsp. pneumoniae TaxID=72407 RepID=A0A377ZDM6_KLEPN|nr:Uncharacterised protein [Klebsiella pneumoniae subsp. pneumoniae]